jgi:FlaA1/EpsC-like NDP-sugar epimerase
MVGIDVVEHQFAQAILEKGANIIAFIDDEPWSHRTEMLGAPLRYPSEIESLVQRNKAQAVITFNQRSDLLPDDSIRQLNSINKPIVQIDPNLTLNDQLSILSGTMERYEQK